MWLFTTIIHPVRIQFGLTEKEYCIIDTIAQLSANPSASVKGWCNASNITLSKWLGTAPKTIIATIEKATKIGLLENQQGNAGEIVKRRATKLWYSAINNVLPKVTPPVTKSNTPLLPKVTPPVTKSNTDNNIDNNIDNTNTNDGEFDNSQQPPSFDLSPKKQENQEKEKSAAKKEKEVPHLVEFEKAIAILNEKSGRAFVVTELDRKGKTDKYKKFAGLMAKGYSLEDIALVITDKCNEWRNDSKMAKYLQPATLFGSVKFEQYLEAIKAGLPTNEQTNYKQEPPFDDAKKEERYQNTIAWIVKRFEYIGESKVRQLNREEFKDIFCEDGQTYNQLKNYLSIKNIFSIFEQLLQRLATDNYLKKSTLYTHLLKSLKEEKAAKLKQRI